MGQVTSWFTDLGIVALISIGGTYIGLAKMMQRRYQTLIAAEIERVFNRDVNARVDAKLDVLKRRMMFLTLVTDRICKELKVPECDIDSFRRTCEINQHDPG